MQAFYLYGRNTARSVCIYPHSSGCSPGNGPDKGCRPVKYGACPELPLRYLAYCPNITAVTSAAVNSEMLLFYSSPCSVSPSAAGSVSVTTCSCLGEVG